MTKSNDMEYLIGREKHERRVAALSADPALRQVHERFADGYAKRIAELNTVPVVI